MKKYLLFGYSLIFLGVFLLENPLYLQEVKPQSDSTCNQINPEEIKKILELIKQLGVDDWKERELAQRKLFEIGSPARPFLEKALRETNDPEIRLRVKKLLEDIPDTLAKEAFIQGMKNLLNCPKGFRIRGQTLRRWKNFNMEHSQKFEDIYHKNPDFTCSISIYEDHEEITYYRKDNKVLFKSPEGWSEGSEENIIELVPRSNEVTKADYIEKANITGEEKVNGVDCKIIQADLKPGTFKELFGPIPKSYVFISKVQYQIWLGKEDNLIYKAICTISVSADEADEEIETITEMNFSYGDIKLEVPEEVKKFLGIEK